MNNMWMGITLMSVGLFTLAGAAWNWDWFMHNRRARLFVKLLSRQGARIFYACLGILFILIGLLVLAGILNPS